MSWYKDLQLMSWRTFWWLFCIALQISECSAGKVFCVIRCGKFSSIVHTLLTDLSRPPVGAVTCVGSVVIDTCSIMQARFSAVTHRTLIYVWWRTIVKSIYKKKIRTFCIICEVCTGYFIISVTLSLTYILIKFESKYEYVYTI